MSNTPRTDEIIKDFVSGNGEAASIMLLRQDVEQLEAELADKEKQLAEAQADAEHWKSECNTLQRMVHEALAVIEHKNRLIEQMREAPRLALPEARSTHREKAILAALAAERGE